MPDRRRSSSYSPPDRRMAGSSHAEPTRGQPSRERSLDRGINHRHDNDRGRERDREMERYEPRRPSDRERERHRSRSPPPSRGGGDREHRRPVKREEDNFVKDEPRLRIKEEDMRHIKEEDRRHSRNEGRYDDRGTSGRNDRGGRDSRDKDRGRDGDRERDRAGGRREWDKDKDSQRRYPEENFPPPPAIPSLKGEDGFPADDPLPGPPKEAPNMGLSGKLAAETNKVEGGVVLKHQPPMDAAKPDKKWRLYVFKDGKMQDEPLYIHRNDHFLFGRDVNITDVLCAHPSISKQHAVIQFRKTVSKADDREAIRPYIMDLGTVNGTFINGERIESERFYELLIKDNIKFGMSSREYLLLHDDV